MGHNDVISKKSRSENASEIEPLHVHYSRFDKSQEKNLLSFCVDEKCQNKHKKLKKTQRKNKHISSSIKKQLLYSTVKTQIARARETKLQINHFFFPKKKKKKKKK